MQNEVYDVAVRESTPLTAVQIRAQVNLIQEVMQAVMKKDVHYGVIPGTPKPTLYKAGAEKILSTFRIGVEPETEDLSNYETAHYRVKAKGFDQKTGALLGVGVGECSSDEEKYKWRRPVCDEEFNETPDDRKREVWKKYRESGVEKFYKAKQIRTNPADVANTILKMAKKRAQIDLTLTVTAASDVFDQDLEDLPEELRQENGEQKAALKEPQKKAAAEKKDVPQAAESITVLVKSIFHDPGEKNGKKYVKHTVIDMNDVRYTTFSDTLAGEAAKAKDSGAKVKIGFNTGKLGREIVTLEIDVPEEG